MKNRYIFFSFLISILFSQIATSQEKGVSNRLKIYATKTELLKLRKLGVDMDHGLFDDQKNTFVSDFDASYLQKIKGLGYKVDVLVSDVFAYTDSLNKVQDPYMYANDPVKIGDQFENLRMNFTTSCQNYEAYIATPTTFVLGSRGGFYTLAELEAQIDDMVADYPGLVTKTSIGNTLQGRPIWAVKISDNAATDEAEPEVSYTGMHHSREGMSMMNLIFFMRYILENYSTNTHIQDLVNSRELFFVPVSNIDGFNYNTTLANWNAGRRMRRKNMRSVPGGYDPNAAISGANADGSGGPGVDMNRNYATYWGTAYSNSNTASSGTASSDAYRGTAAFSEPETQVMRDYVNARNFKVALNYHCYGNWWIRPQGPDPAVYGGVSLPTADVNVYNSIASLFAKYNCYVYGTAKQTVYDVNGYSDDWLFSDASHSKVFAFSPEIGATGDGFWCPQARIIPYAKELIFPNLQAAYTAGGYAELQDNSDISISSLTGSFSYTVTRKGLTDAPISVTLIPLANIQSVTGSPSTITSIANFGGTSTGSIGYTLPSTLAAGSIVRYVWRLQTDGITINDTITKLYSPTVLFEDDMETAGNFATKWVRSGTGAAWGYQASNGVGATASLTESPAGNYANNADHIIRLASAVDLTSSTKAFMSFMIKYNSENCQDRLQVEVSTTGTGGTYTPICTNNTITESRGSMGGVSGLTGQTDGWIRQIVDLTSYAGNNNVSVRFRFRSNASNGAAYTGLVDGFNLDNFKIVKTNASTLPVNFEDISAQRQGDAILVKWKAQIDANFEQYEVQRSANGLDFVTISSSKDGTLSTYTDHTPLKGFNYYRIKATDKDNSYRLSKTVVVIFEEAIQLSVYPNPARDKVNIDIVQTGVARVYVEVSTLAGQAVYTKELPVRQGSITVQINTTNWPNQLYVVKLRDEAGNVLKITKLIKQ
jgi:hypothetical protein